MVHTAQAPRRLAATLALLILAPYAHADVQTYAGKLKSEFIQGQAHYRLEIGPALHLPDSLPLDLSPEIRSSIDTLVDRAPYFSVDGNWDPAQGTLHVSRIPTMLSGNARMAGDLDYDPKSGKYRLNGIPARFAKAAPVNGYAFNTFSGQQFADFGKVIARGFFEGDEFVITAAIPAELFRAETRPWFGLESWDVQEGFLRDPMDFVLNQMQRNIYSQRRASFRGTLFADPTRETRPGDSILIITMSGRQGDDAAAVPGHFAVGQGWVNADGQIKGELFNIYFPITNEKQIVTGNLSLEDYFGHVTGGQNNYRPTFTLLLYGVSVEKNQAIRDEIDRFQPTNRTVPMPLTPNYNCTTLSVLAMATHGVYGKHRNGKNGGAQFPILTADSKIPALRTGIFSQLGYIVENSPEEFMPRPAFNAIVANLGELNQTENLGAYRADYIYYAQTLSDRPPGRMAVRDRAQGLFIKVFPPSRANQLWTLDSIK